jgi:hypothetical protein
MLIETAIVVFSLYGLILFLLLTNYIYHAITVHGSPYLYKKLVAKSLNKLSTMDVQSKSKDHIKTKGSSRVRFFQPLVTFLQPFVIYVSTALGWFVVSCILLFAKPAILPLFSAIVIVVILWSCIFGLGWLHIHAREFAKNMIDDMLDSDTSQQLSSGDANRVKENSTAI